MDLRFLNEGTGEGCLTEIGEKLVEVVAQRFGEKFLGCGGIDKEGRAEVRDGVTPCVQGERGERCHDGSVNTLKEVIRKNRWSEGSGGGTEEGGEWAESIKWCVLMARQGLRRGYTGVDGIIVVSGWKHGFSSVF